MQLTVVGAGYAGLRLIQQLAPQGFDITLIEPSPHHVLRTRLGAVASLRRPLKESLLLYSKLLPNGVRWIQEPAVAFDPDLAQVDTDHHSVQSDRVILAYGSTTAHLVPGSERLGLSTYTLAETEAVLAHWAKMQQDLEAQRCDPALLRWVVVGGGETGVALAAELVPLARRWRNRYGGQAGAIQVYLLHQGDQLLPGWRSVQGEWAKDWLLRNRVFVQTQTRVKRVRPGQLVLEGPTGTQDLTSQTIFWATGTTAQRLEEEAPQLREGGYFRVNQTLQLVDYPRIYALGGLIEAHSSTRTLQQADHVAQVLVAERDGRTPAPFVAQPDTPALSLGAFDGLAMLGDQDLFGTAGWTVAQAADSLYFNTVQTWNLPRLNVELRP